MPSWVYLHRKQHCLYWVLSLRWSRRTCSPATTLDLEWVQKLSAYIIYLETLPCSSLFSWQAQFLFCPCVSIIVRKRFAIEKINASAIRKRSMYTSLQQLHRRRRGSIDEENWWSCFPLSALDHSVLESSTSNVMPSCALGVPTRLCSPLDSRKRGPLLFPVAGHFSATTTFLRLSWGDGETWIRCNLLVLVLNTFRESGSFVTCSFRLWVDMFLSRSSLNNQLPFASEQQCRQILAPRLFLTRYKAVKAYSLCYASNNVAQNPRNVS